MILRKELFWEYDVSKLGLEKDQRTIIPRVLERGTLNEWKEILNLYGREKVQEVLLSTPYLGKKSLNFASFVFDIPIEKFRCYTQKQLNRAHWDF